MASRIRRELRALRDDEPGARFENGYERIHLRNKVLRMVVLALGVVLMASAAVTFVLPGPNFVLVLVGLALIAGQSRTIARLIDRAEVAGRRWHEHVWLPYGHKSAAKVVAALVVCSGAAAIAWYLYSREMIPYLQ